MSEAERLTAPGLLFDVEVLGVRNVCTHENYAAGYKQHREF